MATSGQLTWARLVAIARRVGVEVIEAPSSHRGKLGTMGSVVGITKHTTGTANTFKPTDDYPDYNVVKEGRTGLVNSLSAFGLGRFKAIYVFSEYLSWHAGTWNWRGITDGNGHFLGIECAGVGDYTEFQRKVYPRLVAAILLDIGQDHNWHPRHLDGATPAGRKVDAQSMVGDFYQGKSFDQWVDYFLANPAYININYNPGGTFLMALSDSEQAEILNFVRHYSTPLDYRTHPDNPVDDFYGHAMSARKEVAKLTPGVAGDHDHGIVYQEFTKLVPGVENLHPHGEVYNMLAGMSANLNTLLSRDPQAADIDEAALASAFAAAVPQDLAQRVVDELKTRL